MSHQNTKLTLAEQIAQCEREIAAKEREIVILQTGPEIATLQTEPKKPVVRKIKAKTEEELVREIKLVQGQIAVGESTKRKHEAGFDTVPPKQRKPAETKPVSNKRSAPIQTGEHLEKPKNRKKPKGKTANPTNQTHFGNASTWVHPMDGKIFKPTAHIFNPPPFLAAKVENDPDVQEAQETFNERHARYQWLLDQCTTDHDRSQVRHTKGYKKAKEALDHAKARFHSKQNKLRLLSEAPRAQDGHHECRRLTVLYGEITATHKYMDNLELQIKNISAANALNKPFQESLFAQIKTAEDALAKAQEELAQANNSKHTVPMAQRVTLADEVVSQTARLRTIKTLVHPGGVAHTNQHEIADLNAKLSQADAQLKSKVAERDSLEALFE